MDTHFEVLHNGKAHLLISTALFAYWSLRERQILILEVFLLRLLSFKSAST